MLVGVVLVDVFAGVVSNVTVGVGVVTVGSGVIVLVLAGVVGTRVVGHIRASGGVAGHADDADGELGGELRGGNSQHGTGNLNQMAHRIRN